jgi:uncharacterized protein (TIGR00251 family)
VITDAPEGARQKPDGGLTSKAALIDLKVIPRAGQTALAGTRDNALLVRLAAPPVEGAANAALIEFLAGVLHIPKRDIEIVAGEKSRSKRVKVWGLDAAQVRARLDVPEKGPT